MPRPSSNDYQPSTLVFSRTRRTSSTLYSLLPSAVKSRLPRLPTLRRPVRENQLEQRIVALSKAPGSDSLSPGSGAMVLGSNKEDYTYSMDSTPTLNSPRAIQRWRPQKEDLVVAEERSGIGWKFANQGFSLLSLSAEESSTVSQDGQFGNASFARQLYIHAITYLLRALPPDLTAEEQFSVRAALPPVLAQPIRLELDPQIANPQPSNPPSLLHRTLASAIVQLVIIFQFFLPYIKFLLNAAYHYEREHKITEKLLVQSVETVDNVGKQGLSISTRVLAMGDGKVGQMLGDAARWFVEGVTGGIHEGVCEGMVIVGAKKMDKCEVGTN